MTSILLTDFNFVGLMSARTERDPGTSPDPDLDPGLMEGKIGNTRKKSSCDLLFYRRSRSPPRRRYERREGGGRRRSGSRDRGSRGGGDKQNFMKEGRCFICGERGHIKRDCP